MMMIVPVDSYIDKTENISQKLRKKRFETGPAVSFRNFQLKYHDGDDDGQNTITESF
jgi:hypothetical protein